MKLNGQNFLEQIINGYEPIYENNIIHRDLKPENILINPSSFSKNIYKIADFGTGKIYKQNDYTFTQVGTPVYASPETNPSIIDPSLTEMILYHKKEPHFKSKVDIYSLGIILYQIYFGQLPFSTQSPLNIVEFQKSLKVTPFKIARPTNKSEPIVQLIESMIQYYPDKRISFPDLKQKCFEIKQMFHFQQPSFRPNNQWNQGLNQQLINNQQQIFNQQPIAGFIQQNTFKSVDVKQFPQIQANNQQLQKNQTSNGFQNLETNQNFIQQQKPQQQQIIAGFSQGNNIKAVDVKQFPQIQANNQQLQKNQTHFPLQNQQFNQQARNCQNLQVQNQDFTQRPLIFQNYNCNNPCIDENNSKPRLEKESYISRCCGFILEFVKKRMDECSVQFSNEAKSIYVQIIEKLEQDNTHFPSQLLQELQKRRYYLYDRNKQYGKKLLRFHYCIMIGTLQDSSINPQFDLNDLEQLKQFLDQLQAK